MSGMLNQQQNKQTNKQTAEDCPGIELNGQSLEIVKTFCYLGDTKGASEGTVGNVRARSRVYGVSLEIQWLY